jgi:hypothetical protein
VKRTAWLGANENSIVEDYRGRIGPGAEYHCAHGEDNDILVFTVLDMKAVDYVTIVIPVGDGIGLRYTDYVIPSGTGTRIVSYSAPPFMTESGEEAPAEVLAEMLEPLRDNYSQSVQRLAELADAAAETLAIS